MKTALTTTSESNTRKKPRAPSVVMVSPFTEFTDFHGLLVLFGLRRSLAYHLINNEPELKGASISLKGKGERGKRLFNVARFRKFLEAKLQAAS
jgi:hypothetical protein